METIPLTSPQPFPPTPPSATPTPTPTTTRPCCWRRVVLCFRDTSFLSPRPVPPLSFLLVFNCVLVPFTVARFPFVLFLAISPPTFPSFLFPNSHVDDSDSVSSPLKRFSKSTHVSVRDSYLPKPLLFTSGPTRDKSVIVRAVNLSCCRQKFFVDCVVLGDFTNNFFYC